MITNTFSLQIFLGRLLGFTVKFQSLKISPLLAKFIRFGIVGFAGFIVDFTVTWFLRDIAGVFEYLANALGFSFGATSNYILNRRWTWRSDNPNIGREYARFFGVSLVGLGINSLVIWICLRIGGLDFSLFGIYVQEFWVAKVIATAVVTVWNFFANNFFTFRKR